ncbi:MAG: hypothetical protein HKN80_05275, partial [Acidimicrobiia bacterium]|nr:hypothetical protein [Acidimicrobiia bacterium]
MTDQQQIGEEPPSFHADAYERKWIGFSVVMLVAFAITVAVAGFAFGFQVPGDESRVDPRTVADAPPWSQPGLRDLGGGE